MISVMALIETSTELGPDVGSESLDALRAQADGTDSILGQVFNRVSDSSQKGIDYARGGIHLDAIAQFFCPDISSGMSAAASGALDLAMGVPGHLIEEMNPILCLQNTVVPAPSDTSCLKRMSILRKRPDVSAEEFQEQWFDLHAILVKRLPGLRGYRQNLVLDGPRDPEGHMMVDGMVELWFDDTDAIEAAFRSDIGTTIMTHAREFIAEIATFLVDPVHISGVS
jgi:uncharacterized protein (TIGR02118 family)